MKRPMAKHALVLGGAGFVGSAIAREFVRAGWNTQIIDCLRAEGFGDTARFQDFADKITFTMVDISDVADLEATFSRFDVVVDAIGLSRHSIAERYPFVDLELNLRVHLPVFRSMTSGGPRLIHLGALHQFGGASGEVGDDDRFMPIDVQGVHKCAAEEHLRLHCLRTGASASVLRIGNCIGPGQPVDAGDVGLFGGLLRDLRAGKTVAVFDGNRARHLSYTPDVGRLAVSLAEIDWSGFHAVNVPGELVEVLAVAREMQRQLGVGEVKVTPLPAEFAGREIRPATFPAARLRQLAPQFATTPLALALRAAVDSARES